MGRQNRSPRCNASSSDSGRAGRVRRLDYGEAQSARSDGGPTPLAAVPAGSHLRSILLEDASCSVTSCRP